MGDLTANFAWKTAHATGAGLGFYLSLGEFLVSRILSLSMHILIIE